mmetsp:Transcript_38820/g.99183  ORF Transcript_38820/g.99183 Transcript_38820/m.99183 type:complete len:257 (+) Transcript_38820:94-864(+)
MWHAHFELSLELPLPHHGYESVIKAPKFGSCAVLAMQAHAEPRALLHHQLHVRQKRHGTFFVPRCRHAPRNLKPALRRRRIRMCSSAMGTIQVGKEALLEEAVSPFLVIVGAHSKERDTQGPFLLYVDDLEERCVLRFWPHAPRPLHNHLCQNTLMHVLRQIIPLQQDKHSLRLHFAIHLSPILQHFPYLACQIVRPCVVLHPDVLTIAHVLLLLHGIPSLLLDGPDHLQRNKCHHHAILSIRQNALDSCPRLFTV